LLKKNALPKRLVDNEEFPFLLLTPQCLPKDHWVASKIKITLDQFIQEYPVDKQRIYLTGLSMGGFGAFNLAGAYPSYFAALAPICGGGRREDASKLKKIPTWVFHGAKDSVVHIIRSEEMVAAIQKLNGDVKFTIYPEGEHDVWTETYDNPELYEWFLKHSRK
jgi:predicted peptidase